MLQGSKKVSLEETKVIKEDFRIPNKTILTKKDLEGFLNSEAKSQLLEFLTNLSNSVRGKTLSASLEPLSPVLYRVSLSIYVV